MNVTGSKDQIQIVLLDDEPSVLFALKLLLEAIGYKVADFATPAEAISFLKEGQHCDLFLCDLRMPAMNGLKVLEEAKKIRSELPFLLMSAHATRSEQDQAQSLGACGFIAKPFTPDELNLRLKDIVVKD